MIKFFSSVDEVENEELEGRIVMQAVMQDWPAFRHPCRVLQQTEKSAVVERLHANYDDELKSWIFTEKTAGEQQVIRLSEIKAICDSATEANSIVRKSIEAVERYQQTRDQLLAEFGEMAANSPSSGPRSNRSTGCHTG
ncbi:hypothetical protein OIU34_21125 [Pararhizobium sp. BT-229]|uniref:hypothetical protein n=1 Tax=Pararhizobium sp. BT-229 TaxID=2986923 RepID=UPI0021F6F7C8|nr:hypothetical protein [Pararhizobium sp. BT-229]MCV9964394.1 hypothetical protein [Pararhizobium sp. BT-229]